MTQGKIERSHRSLKNVVKLEHYYSRWELERAIARFGEDDNRQRYHESLQNVTPDAYFGRQATILARRERIKQRRFQRGNGRCTDAASRGHSLGRVSSEGPERSHLL
jgi:transposase InsO family protein